MTEQLKNALLIFARKPLPGKVKTRLVPPLSPEQAADLYGCMMADVISKVAGNPLFDVFLFYEKADGAQDYFARHAAGMTCLPQCGKDLGERMAAAFQDVYAMGHGTAVIIGTDSPDLPLNLIEAAFDLLDRGVCKVVFGPCEDGGYYLLGINSLYPVLFHEVPWSSDKVLGVSMERAKEAGITVSLLPVWYDVDTAADLERPELLDERNGALLTREYLKKLHNTR